MDLKRGVEPFPAGSLVLSVLKQRSWDQYIPFLAKVTEKSGAFYYDQDPWEAYYSGASSPGVYRKLASMVPVRSFLVTSRWWANYIAKTDNLPTKFVRMGMLPKLCNRGPIYEKRPVEIGFQGSLHDQRTEFFQRMTKLGIDTQFLPSVPYKKFLKSVQDIRIFLHRSVLPDGSPFNGLWAKEIEVAARGTFAIRNWDEDADAYGIDEIPTVFPFEDESDVPDIIEKIRSMSAQDRNSRIDFAVSKIKERDDWQTVADAILY